MHSNSNALIKVFLIFELGSFFPMAQVSDGRQCYLARTLLPSGTIIAAVQGTSDASSESVPLTHSIVETLLMMPTPMIGDL